MNITENLGALVKDDGGGVVNGVASVSLYSGMVPNLGFNIAMLSIWGVLLSSHVLLVWLKQYWFSTAFICAGILEVIGYAGRVWSHFNVFMMDPFLMQMVCLTIAPVFTMGGIYYQLAKMIEVYGHRFCLLPSPMAYSYIFIGFDIVSLVVQAAGGGVAGSDTATGNESDTGDNIFIAGLALQVASMTIFIALMGHLYYRVFVKTRLDHTGTKKPTFSLFKIPQSEIDYLYRQKFSDLRIHPKRWVFHCFPHALTLAVCTVFVRCCYRLAELITGWSGYLITHENYFIILDALMIAIATVSMTVFHPGFAFEGRQRSIPITAGKVDPETITPPESDKVESISSNEPATEKKKWWKPFSKKDTEKADSDQWNGEEA